MKTLRLSTHLLVFNLWAVSALAQATPCYAAPPVLSQGTAIPHEFDSETEEPVVNVSCSEGSLRVRGAQWIDGANAADAEETWKRRLYACGKNIPAMARDTYDILLPSLHACIVQAATAAKMPLQTSSVITIFHGGFIVQRKVANSEDTSLHHYGRATDLLAVQIDSLPVVDYYQDFRFPKNGRLASFWNPLTDCLKKTPGIKALDHRYDASHENHIHVSVPYAERKEGVARGE
jgi:hypothetical protein